MIKRKCKYCGNSTTKITFCSDRCEIEDGHRRIQELIERHHRDTTYLRKENQELIIENGNLRQPMVVDESETVKELRRELKCLHERYAKDFMHSRVTTTTTTVVVEEKFFKAKNGELREKFTMPTVISQQARIH